MAGVRRDVERGIMVALKVVLKKLKEAADS
jgi:hypothetical protein